METQGVMPTSVQPFILPDTDDSDDDIKSPEAPPCSPISFSDDILPVCETVPEGSTDESDQEPRLEDEAEFESNVCILYYVYLHTQLVSNVCFSCFHRQVILHHKQTCGLATSLWEII